MDVLKKINSRVFQLSDLYTRMDVTRDQVYNKPYQLKGFDGLPMDNIVNITLPYPSIMANTIINDLMEARRQTVIEGDLSNRSKNRVEPFLDDVRAQADEGLRQRGLPKLFDWWCNHVCVRSFIGVRWISQIIDGVYTVDCLPVDMRWTPFQYGKNGLDWVCHITYRNKGDVESEYPDLKNPPKGELDIEVMDYWDKNDNIIFIDGVEAKKSHNPFGYPPFVISSPATGFMLRDQGYMAHESEDILYLLKDIFSELNRSMSIEQTLGMESIRPPYQKPIKPENWDAKPPPAPPKTGQAQKVKEGEEWKLVPRADLNQAFMTGRVDLLKIQQMGGVNDIDLGNVSQTVSAVWITAQTSIRRKFSNPRLACIAEAEAMLARMIIDQIIQGGISVEALVGRIGRKRKYVVADLGNPDNYTITYSLMTHSRTEEISNLAQYEAAGGLPTRWKLEHILKVENPEAIMREMAIEEARQADPAIGLFEIALQLADEANQLADSIEADSKKIQSKMLTEQCVAIIKQRQMPQPLPTEQVAPAPPKPKSNSNLLIPLLGAGGQGPSLRQPQEATK